MFSHFQILFSSGKRIQPPFFFFFPFLCSADHHTGWGPWLTVRGAEETCHSSSYRRVRGAISFSPPPSSSSFSSAIFLPPSILCRYLFNGRVTSPSSQLLGTPENPQAQSKRTHTFKLTLAPPKGSLTCLLTPVEWLAWSGTRRETLCSQTSRRSWERTSHAFPFGVDNTGAVDRCLPGGHAALPCSLGPLRCVQVPSLHRRRLNLGLHGLPARSSRHDPVPEGYLGPPKHHLWRPSRDILYPGEYMQE